MKKHIKTIVFIMLTVLLAYFIFYMSSQDSRESTNVSFGIIEHLGSAANYFFGFAPNFQSMKFAEKILRKSAHFILYTLLGGFLTCVLCRFKKPSWRIWISAVIITACYAAADEFHQIFVPGRSGELRDILIDTSGGILGSGIIFLILLKMRNKREIHSHKNNRSE